MSELLRMRGDQGMRYAPSPRGRTSPLTSNRRYHNDENNLTLACCAFIAPLAFAQTHKKQTATTEQAITVTGTVVDTKPEEGSAANYQPFKTLVIREDKSNHPGRYVLEGSGYVVNKKGELVQTAIKPGTHVLVYYANAGGSRVIDHVVVD